MSSGPVVAMVRDSPARPKRIRWVEVGHHWVALLFQPPN